MIALSLGPLKLSLLSLFSSYLIPSQSDFSSYHVLQMFKRLTIRPYLLIQGHFTALAMVNSLPAIGTAHGHLSLDNSLLVDIIMLHFPPPISFLFSACHWVPSIHFLNDHFPRSYTSWPITFCSLFFFGQCHSPPWHQHFLKYSWFLRPSCPELCIGNHQCYKMSRAGPLWHPLFSLIYIPQVIPSPKLTAHWQAHRPK